jgi:NitT/TauT family transport system substrate-binding protein
MPDKSIQIPPRFSMGRRQLITLAGVAAAGIFAPSVLAQAKLEKSKVVIAVSGKATFYSLPLTISDQLGYFRAEGLDVEFSDFGGDARAAQAVVGAAADLVSSAYEDTINLQSKGQFFQAFVLQGRAPAIAIGVSTKTLSGYREISDLRGKKIGVAAPGSSTNMVSNLVLARSGLKADDVTYVGVGTAVSALSAMRSGQIDAISNIDPVMTMLEQKGDVRLITDTRTLKGTLDVFGGPMPAGCLYAPVEFIQKYPNTTQALANAIVRGLKWLQTAGPGDIIKTVPEAYLLADRGLYLAAFNKVREAIAVDGVIPEDGTRTAVKALAGFDSNVKVDKIVLAKTFTNEFALRAKEKFKA